MTVRLALLGLLLLLIVRVSWASPALILIKPSAAGPPVDIHTYVHPRWILWPESASSDGLARLESLVTGVDWIGSPHDFAFYQAADGRSLRAGSYSALAARGFFAAKRRALDGLSTALVTGPSGAASPSEMLLALNDGSPLVPRFPLAGPVPPNAVLVHEATSWTEAVTLSHLAGGRALVVEFPPLPGETWSRFWTFGRGWPEGLPSDSLNVPGLVAARSAPTLLLHPERLTWRPDDTLRWGGANRWLEFGHGVAPILLGLLGMLAIAACVAGVYCATTERRWPPLRWALAGLLAAPAALVAAGGLGRALGPGGLPMYFLFVEVGLVFLAYAGGALEKRRLAGAHPLFLLAVAGLPILGVFDPRWSVFSSVFGWNVVPTPPEGLAAWFGYLAACIGFRPPGRGWSWGGFLLAAGLTAFGLAGRPWWVDPLGGTAVLPLAAWIVGEQAARPLLWPALAFVSPGFYRLVVRGAAWKPGGLSSDWGDVGVLNLTAYVQFLLSPALIALAGTVALVALFGDRFFVYRMRRLTMADPRRRILFAAAGAMLSVGVFDPEILTAAVPLSVGATAALLFDALEERDPEID